MATGLGQSPGQWGREGPSRSSGAGGRGEGVCLPHSTQECPPTLLLPTEARPTLTVKKASSKTSRGPEKPMTSSGWAPSRQKSTPCSDVEMISSDTPIRSCVFSPAGRTGSGTPGGTGAFVPGVTANGSSYLLPPAVHAQGSTQHPHLQCPHAVPRSSPPVQCHAPRHSPSSPPKVMAGDSAAK